MKTRPVVFIHGRPASATFDVGTAGLFDSIAKPFVSAAKAVAKPFAAAAKAATTIVEAPVNAVAKIPVIGDAARLASSVATAPLRIASEITSGARLDHVALDALKSQIKNVKDAAPYAQTVLSFVPGVGTGVAAAVGAGAALAEGQSITDAAKAAIRSSLPGGPLAAAAFDTAMKAASGQNVVQSALESARNAIPAGPARSAFDIGVAVATGEKIQNAIAKGLASLAPGQIQNVIAMGQKAIGSTPGLADAFKAVSAGAAQQGFQFAAGLLGQTGLNEKALLAVRDTLTPDMLSGFDAALKTQQDHLPWVKNVIGAPVRRAPTIRGVPKSPVPTIKGIKSVSTPTRAAPTKPLVKLTISPKAVKPVVANKVLPGGYAPYPVA